MKKISIVLADDHAILRQGIISMLKREEDFEVVGEASTGREAIEQAANLNPSIVVMDVSMPEINGIDATKEIMKINPSAKIIVLSMWRNEDLVKEAIKAGAKGYVVKESIAAELMTAIREIDSGNVFFSPSVLKILHKEYLQSEGKKEHLTVKEHEILRLLTDGKTNKEIGIAMSISAKTVEKHCLQIMKKLGISDRAGLMRYAITKLFLK